MNIQILDVYGATAPVLMVGTLFSRSIQPRGAVRKSVCTASVSFRLLRSVACVAVLAFLSSGCTDSHHGHAKVPPSEAFTADEEQHPVYFFAPGCPDCREVDETVISELTDRGFVIDKVNVDTPEGFESLRSVKERLGGRLDVLAPIMVYRGKLLRRYEEIRDFFLTESFL